MIEIDGGEGGGQMLRTALTLSAIKGEPFRMADIRGNRSQPGLKRQHVECVKAAAKLCNAEVKGGEEGSGKIVFRPGQLVNKSFTSNIGTAGSITLLLDTLLPVTTRFEKPSCFTARGGTDVKWSPTLDYFKHVKLPLLEKFGLDADLKRVSTGYYPTGGGEAVLKTRESSIDSIKLMERGGLKRFEVYSRASKSLEKQVVADRQADEAAKSLKEDFVSLPIEKNVSYVEAVSPGSSLLIKAVYENSVAGFDALGEKGKRSEDVALEAVKEFRSFQESEAAVEEYMADQLMVFLAVAGGKVSIPGVTDHIGTNLKVVNSFGFDMDIEKDKAGKGEKFFVVS